MYQKIKNVFIPSFLIVIVSAFTVAFVTGYIHVGKYGQPAPAAAANDALPATEAIQPAESAVPIVEIPIGVVYNGETAPPVLSTVPGESTTTSSSTTLPPGILAPPKQAEVKFFDTDDINWSSVKYREDLCVAEFEGLSKLCVNPLVGVDTDNGYIAGQPFDISVRLSTNTAYGGCESLEECFVLLDKAQCSELLQNLYAIGRHLGSDTNYNDGVPGIPKQYEGTSDTDITVSYWDEGDDAENLRIHFRSDCPVSTTQIESETYEVPGG